MNKIKYLFRPVVWWVAERYPRAYVRIRYWIRFHKFANLKTPVNLNEKILYLSLNTDTSRWSELADKYMVRGYVEDCGYNDALVKLYGVWNNAEDIDFDALPQSFVLKTNHGCGDVKIITDKSAVNKGEIVKYFNSILHRPYGGYQLHYSRIEPKIIAEWLLINDDLSERFSKSIIDYKFWCFNGCCHYIWVCRNRDKHGAEVLAYDRDWKEHPEYSVFTKHYRRSGVIPRPENLEKMIELAESLAKPFPCVRVDLYNIGGKIYFGEMTFTSLGGMMNYFTNEFLNKAGEMIDLNYKG